MFKKLAAAGVVALWSTSAFAASIDFDFNFDDTDSAADATVHGEQVTAFDFGNGLTGNLFVTSRSGEARIFDPDVAANQANGDTDLLNPFTNAIDSNDVRTFGNALIIQEGGGASTPDDEAQGGTIRFVFDQAIDLLGAIYLDGERGASINAQMQQVGVFAAGVAGDNEFQELDLSGSDLTKGIFAFEVVFNGSGAIGELDIELAAVPLPAGLPLLLAGLGGIALVRRNRKTS